MKGTYEFEALSKAQSDWRVSQQGKLAHKDLFTSLLEARDPETGKALSLEELIAEAGILIVAGTDTSKYISDGQVRSMTYLCPQLLRL